MLSLSLKCPGCAAPLSPDSLGQRTFCHRCTGSTDRLAPTRLEPVEAKPCLTNLPTVTFVKPPQAIPPMGVTRVDSRVQRFQRHGLTNVRRLSRGGMGDLYLTWDDVRQCETVVKFLRPEARSEQLLTRFKTEAAVLASLNHPNLCQLFEAVDGDDPFFTMEFVAGGTLADWLVYESALAPEVVAEVMTGAARGVAEAHRQGVIHRDLKPSNILLQNRDGRTIAKVSDFGMAKRLDCIDGPTGSQMILGTPGYLAPEQAARRSADCDARTDVWGLAATFYCCVVGHPPMSADPASANRPSQIISPQVLRPDLSPGLNAIICKGLEWDPKLRYQTADDFADDLQRYLTGQRIRAIPALPKRVWQNLRQTSKSSIAITFLVMVCVALGLLSFAARPAISARELSREELAEQRIHSHMSGLKQGKTAILIGETGLPVWSKPLRGLPTIGSVAAAPNICAVGGGATDAWLQLTPELPIDDYTLYADLCQLDASTTLNEIGLATCVEIRPDQTGVEHMSALQITFSDVGGWGGKPTRNNNIFAGFSYTFQPPGETLKEGVCIVANPLFMPSAQPQKMGIWRTFRIRVWPDGNSASWTPTGCGQTEQLLFNVRPKELDFRMGLALINKAISPFQPGLAIRGFSRSGPICVYAKNATLGIRNVIVVPTLR